MSYTILVLILLLFFTLLPQSDATILTTQRYRRERATLPTFCCTNVADCLTASYRDTRILVQVVWAPLENDALTLLT